MFSEVTFSFYDFHLVSSWHHTQTFFNHRQWIPMFVTALSVPNNHEHRVFAVPHR